MNLLSRFFSLSDYQISQFHSLEKLYVDWNQKINLISRKDIAHLIEKHFLHSLSITKKYELVGAKKVLDIGTGGGFPGIPLAILYPDVNFILVDSIQKKITVINDIKEKMNLKNVTTICSRVENIYRKDIDLVVSRATAPLANLIAWTMPLLNPESNFLHQGLLCFKGGNLKDEILLSQSKPTITDLYEIINLEYYQEKFILYLSTKDLTKLL